MSYFCYESIKARGFVIVPPQVVTFTPSPAIAEIGSTVEDVVLIWELNKRDSKGSLTVNGQALYPFRSSLGVPGPFTEDQVWTLNYKDETGQTSGKASLLFLNSAYWDVVQAAPTTSEEVLAMENFDWINRNRYKRIVYSTAAGGFPCYAYPSRYGAPSKVIMGVDSDIWNPQVTFTKLVAGTDYVATTVDVTNDSGYTEPYTVLTFTARRQDRDGACIVDWH